MAVKNILDRVDLVLKANKEDLKATGQNFNIFSLLQMEADEKRTHSRFIADLLSPTGSHDQGDIFLRCFLECFDIVDFDTTSAVVLFEYYIGRGEEGGFIDIVVKDGLGHHILIENKIYALEQKQQLLRYHKAFPAGHLFFLTLDGRQSINHQEFNKYIAISYRNDIINWLLACENVVADKPIIKVIIAHYIHVIKKLTCQDLNTRMKEDIKQIILEDLEAARMVRTVMNTMETDVIDKLNGVFLLFKEREHQLKGIISDVFSNADIKFVPKFPYYKNYHTRLDIKISESHILAFDFSTESVDLNLGVWSNDNTFSSFIRSLDPIFWKSKYDYSTTAIAIVDQFISKTLPRTLNEVGQYFENELT